MEEYLLAIESSCDDTAAAVLQLEGKLLSNVVAAQLQHQAYGGVVPELAARKHEQAIGRVVKAALERAKVSPTALKAVAFTQGPGLQGALMVGAGYAKGLALSLGIPLIAVDHLTGHLLSVRGLPEPPAYPYLALTVSGGHTDLTLVHGPAHIERIGKTLDDAAGEAFDKIGKLLGLPYPAGPALDKLAQGVEPEPKRFPYPKVEGFNFSFSGLKTAVLYDLQKRVAEAPDYIERNKASLAASVQDVIIRFLLDKLFQAAETYQVAELAIVGGVSANSALRKQAKERAVKHGCQVFIPPIELCTDNAAMIGFAALEKYQQGDFASLQVTTYPSGKRA